jgi:(1->4)-alpha-D-glucan 1-alpha-D-glucosylmutase
MNASSTHDTKRGEDNRLRINLISLFADAWIKCVGAWEQENLPLVKTRHQRRSPSRNHEYLIYQALVGAWPGNGKADPDFRERFSAYLTKALREGDQETHWHAPDLEYEEDCHSFVDGILSPQHSFLTSFLPFVQKIIGQAAVFSLGQTLLKLTAPGIPDIYQGAELWDLSLVDPDNRRPVDFDRRREILDAILAKERKEAPASELSAYILSHRTSGAQKLWLIRQTLQFRKAHPDLFIHGEYLPVSAGPEVIAYRRRYQDQQILVVVTLPSTATAMPVSGIANIRGRWKNLLTGEKYNLQDSLDSQALLRSFPVALLFRENN